MFRKSICCTQKTEQKRKIPKNFKQKFKNKENKNLVGILLSNCCALEIIDDKYRLLTSDASYHGIEAYGLKIYWKNNEYYEERIDKTDKFKPLKNLLSKDLKI